MARTFQPGQRIRLPTEADLVKVEAAVPTASGWQLFVEVGPGVIRKLVLSADAADDLVIVAEDGAADPAVVLAGLWNEWMSAATLETRSAALVTNPLKPYAHQTTAVYGSMLPQPRLRFLLADEPGTGKTIMAGMYVREMQRLGFVRRALVICPAHLVEKWRADFDRFFGARLRRITAATVREGALGIDQDLWVTSLDLASVNPAVQEAIHPNKAGWDLVVIDEAHRMTLSAQTYYYLGRQLSEAPRVLLMTATPHRGNELLFRGLLHLVDPAVFPAVTEGDDVSRQLRPGPVHFLRRMKEDLVDFDGFTPLFKGRRAHNIAVALNATEQSFYDQALALVDRYFPAGAVALARSVYGKRAASSLYALRETLQRRHDVMGSDSPAHAAARVDPEAEDEAERDLARVVVEQSSSARAEKAELRLAIRQLDDALAAAELRVSKWAPTIDDCLKANGILPGNGLQAVVFTEFADTADWLVGRFRVSGFSACRYSGRDSDEARETARRQFANRAFQVIVSTDAGNEGIDLQSAHVLINWDIPWSLVRLEQRMGRIHRIGQARDVELYSLVATGTREGDVLEVLLTNLLIAARQLQGKIFDSLSLLAELVDLDFAQTLARTYDSPPAAAAALASAKAVSAHRLMETGRRMAAQEDALKSAVDITQAVASLHDETLERINPRIVDTFLTRLASARLLEVSPHAAGSGIFVLEADYLRVPSLQASLGERLLVATSGRSLEEAREAGADISAARVVGPGDPVFAAIVNGVRGVSRDALFRGGRLLDRTSITEYLLVVYEAVITDFGGQRQSTWRFLVRADATGARKLRWEWLANLEPGEALPTAPHPGRLLDADLVASDAVEQERRRRATVLGEWMLTAGIELERLPSALTSHIDDPEARLAARQRVKVAVGARLEELQRVTIVSVAEATRLGWAFVAAAGTAVAPIDADSETIAMQHVADLLRSGGWSVADVHLEGRGYDLLARKGRAQRSIEVKGVRTSASAEGVRVTGQELLIARQLGNEYWLYVVDHCGDGAGKLFGSYQDPAKIFGDLMRDLTVVAISGSALAAARAEAAVT